MSRRLRFVPESGTLVEVTCRIIHGRMLLKPSRELNESIIGTLARATNRYGVRICAAVYLSNHAHLLLVVDDAHQLAKFMGFVNSKIAREVSRLTGWREKVWGGRYKATVVSDEPEAQVARLRYVLSQGVKENLVARCSDWPGVHSAEPLVRGRALVGYWFDRSAEYRARLRGEKARPYAHAQREVLGFDPLPCAMHMNDREYRALVRALVDEIELEARYERRRSGRSPLGVRAICRQNPRHVPKRLERSPPPTFHTASKKARRSLEEAYRWFVQAYRDASDRLRAGDRNAKFPSGCFPPAMPFVASRTLAA